MTVTHLPTNPTDLDLELDLELDVLGPDVDVDLDEELSDVLPGAVYLDPAELVDNPRNLRTDLGDLEDLKGSIAEVGRILCPLIIVPITEVEGESAAAVRYQIIIGHRRKYAAIEVGLPKVPCWIADDEGAALQIVAQLAENGHRIGLTPTEEAEGYHQLTLLDWTAERIAAMRVIPVAQVRQSLRLRELPDAARTAADSGVLTLEDAAKMAEFAEEPTAMARIIKAAGDGGWNFQHAIAAERAKRDFTTAKERVKAELIVAGVKVTGKPKGFPYDGIAVAAKSLLDADGNRLDPDEVKALPGFAAYVEKIGTQAQPVVYCSTPEKYGYTKTNPTRHSSAHLSDEQRAEREAAEAAHTEYLAGLAVAEPVRRDFYRQTYGSARAAKKLFVEALRETVLNAAALRFTEGDGLYGALGGADEDAVKAAGEDKLRRCLVAQWICAHENNLTQLTHDRSWGVDEEAAVWWLDRLVADGYTLSDAETAARKKCADTLIDPADDLPLTGVAAPLTGMTGADPDDVQDVDASSDGFEDADADEAAIEVESVSEAGAMAKEVDTDLALAQLIDAESSTV